MKKIIILVISIFILYGCEKSEVVIPEIESTSLTVFWEHGDYGNSSMKDSSRVYIFDNAEAYNSADAAGSSIDNKSLSDIYPENGGSITKRNSATFENLEPEKYWVKIFNAYNHERLIEHNQDSKYVFEEALVEDALTKVRIETTRLYVSSYTIDRIEIYDLPEEITSNPGESVNLKLLENFPSSYAATDVIRDSRTINIDQPYISYEPTNARISRFNSWWSDPDYYVIVSDPDSTHEEYYEINIFELLNSNAYFGNEYVKFNAENEIKYKLYVTWEINEDE